MLLDKDYGGQTMVLWKNILGASWAVMFIWEKITKRKHFLFKGIFCCKFLILKNNSSISGHKLVV